MSFLLNQAINGNVETNHDIIRVLEIKPNKYEVKQSQQ